MIHIVYPPGSGGHFFLALLMGLDVDSVPPGNEYVDVTKHPRYGADREFCDSHNIREVKRPNTRIVFYFREESTRAICSMMSTAKLVLQTPPNMWDTNTVWCISKYSMANNAKRYRQAYKEAKQLGFPPCSTHTVRFCNAQVPTFKEYLMFDSKHLRKTFNIDYANIPADYRYCVEDLWEGKVENTLFEPYKEQILRWLERNKIILEEYKYKMNITKLPSKITWVE